MKSNRLNYLLVGFCLLSLSFVQPAAADMFEPGFKLRVGGFWAQINSEINVGVPGSDLSQTIDYESDLGLERSKFSPFLEVTYRFNKKHALLFSYLTLPREGVRESVSKPFELEWDGKVYSIQAGVRIKTSLDLDVYQAAYLYNLYVDDKVMVAGTLGVHVAKLTTSYEGTIGVSDGTTVTAISGDGISESVTAPLPDIGLLAYYKTDTGIILGARAQYFQLKLDDIDGLILDLRGELMTYLDKARHWGVGAAFQYYGVKVDYRRKFTTLDAEMSYYGPLVFVQYDF